MFDPRLFDARAEFRYTPVPMSVPRRPGISVEQIFNVVVVAVAIFLLAVLAQRIATSIVLWRQTQLLQAAVSAQRLETERLEKRKHYVQTDEYVEAVARRDMKMAKPGEVAVIATLAPAPQPTGAAPRDWWGQVVGH